MNDVLGRFMGYILAIFVFLLCIILIIVDYQTSIEDQVGQQVTSFVNECRETAVIDAQAYSNLLARVTVYGHYNMRLKIEQEKVYSQTINGRVRTRTGYETVSNDLFNDYMMNGINFYLKTGDRISIEVKEGEGNFATRMKKAITFAEQSKNIIINYGGTVGE